MSDDGRVLGLEGGLMSTLDTLRKIVAKVARCDEEDIDLHMTLSDLRIDSLDWVQVIVAVEGAFNVEIDVDRMSEFGTIGDFVKYIDSLTS